MKKTTPKKMTLTRETLHQLTADQVRGAAALERDTIIDAPKPLTTDSKNVCCA